MEYYKGEKQKSIIIMGPVECETNLIQILVPSKSWLQKVEILTQIVNAQPFLSKYFETTKNVLIYKNKMSALQ